MRILVLASFGLVAACSGGEEKKAEGPVAATLGAGQWEVSYETTAFRSTDGKTPILKSAVGEKETASVCVAAGSESKPDPALFAGAGYDCSYTTTYIKEGRVNAQLSCTREGANGSISLSASGTSTADTIEGSVDATSYLSGDGDFAMSRKITARRTAPACQPAAPKAA